MQAVSLHVSVQHNVAYKRTTVRMTHRCYTIQRTMQPRLYCMLDLCAVHMVNVTT
jgi:hypothetical protein